MTGRFRRVLWPMPKKKDMEKVVNLQRQIVLPEIPVTMGLVAQGSGFPQRQKEGIE